MGFGIEVPFDTVAQGLANMSEIVVLTSGAFVVPYNESLKLLCGMVPS